MNRPWRSAAIGLAAVLAGWESLGAAPASAQAACSTTRIVTVQRVATGITPTILDAWAFKFPTARLVPSSVVVQKFVTCPGVSTVPRVVVVPQPGIVPQVLAAPPAVTVFPMVIDPPMPADPPGSPSSTAHRASPAHLAAAGPPAVVPRDTIRDLAADPQAFSRQTVTVTGVVKTYAARHEGQGVPPVLFELADGEASVLVAAWGPSDLRAGMPVRVTGPFYAAAPFPMPAGAGSRPVIEAQVVVPSR